MEEVHSQSAGWGFGKKFECCLFLLTWAQHTQPVQTPALHCTVTNDHKTYRRSNIHLLAHNFVGRKAGVGLTGSPLRVSKPKSGVGQAELLLGNNLLPGSFSLWAEPVPWGCSTKSPTFLLAVGWGSFSVPRGCSPVFSMHSPHLQSQ